MKDQETVKINLHEEDKKGNIKIEQIKIDKKAKEILDARGVHYEDVINHVVFTDYLSELLKLMGITKKLNQVEQKLLEYVIKDAIAKIEQVRRFNSESLKAAINDAVDSYVETKDAGHLDVTYIIDTYLFLEHTKYN